MAWRIAASYANFLMTNNRIILPLMDEATDAAAIAILEDVYEGRQGYRRSGTRYRDWGR
ncbi:MAG: agmatine deiminase family protein [Shimia sp.]|uniref:agmatine deiminase family protein n=1 Tax=Shimia sp. TaxID=1954381 RepID=UPI0040580E62